jgi:hypothetical protein
MENQMTETEVTVRMLMAAAGLAPSEEEMAALVASYPAHKAGIESLYAIPETRYESPALIFTATPVFADWAE